MPARMRQASSSFGTGTRKRHPFRRSPKIDRFGTPSAWRTNNTVQGNIEEGTQIMTHRTLRAVVLITTLLLTSAAWAVNNEDSVVVTGKYFNPKPGSTQLCAHINLQLVCSMAVPAQTAAVKFFGLTPWDTEFMAGPQQTDILGNVCIKTNWPQGVYRVSASILLPGSYLRQNSYSAPAAVSVFNPNNFCGAQGGGELHLRSYGVPKDIRTTLTTRDATYAFIYKEPVGSQRCPTFGVWYFDNDNPKGPVEFVSRSLTEVNFGIDMDGMTSYDFVEFLGNGYFSQPLIFYMQPVHFYIYADNFPNDSYFYIAIYDFAGNLLYQSAAENLFDELHVFEGKNIVQPCP